MSVALKGLKDNQENHELINNHQKLVLNKKTILRNYRQLGILPKITQIPPK